MLKMPEKGIPRLVTPELPSVARGETVVKSTVANPLLPAKIVPVPETAPAAAIKAKASVVSTAHLVQDDMIGKDFPAHLQVITPAAAIKAKASVVSTAHLVQDDMIGKDFPAHLQVIKVLGKGSYGRTFLVQNRADNADRFVLKVYGVKSDFHTTPAMVQNEWRILNDPAVNLGHGDIIVSGKKQYLPMKRIRGESWWARHHKEPAIAQKKETILTQVKAEVNRLHEAGLVHHDVAPRNVMLEEGTDRVVLIDYGRAYYSTAKEDRDKDFEILEKEM